MHLLRKIALCQIFLGIIGAVIFILLMMPLMNEITTGLSPSYDSLFKTALPAMIFLIVFAIVDIGLSIYQLIEGKHFKHTLTIVTASLSIVATILGVIPTLYGIASLISIAVLIMQIVIASTRNETFIYKQNHGVNVHHNEYEASNSSTDNEIKEIKRRLEKEKLEHEYEELQHKRNMLSKEKRKHNKKVKLKKVKDE